MKFLGNILHLANSGKLIVKTDKTPPAGAFVFTNDKNKIGRVGGIFGPVKNPYVSVNLYRSVNKRDLENRCGEKLFVSTKKEDKEFKKSKSKRNNKSKNSKNSKSSKSSNSKSNGFGNNKKNKNRRNKNGKNTKSSNKKNDRKNKKRRG